MVMSGERERFVNYYIRSDERVQELLSEQYRVHTYMVCLPRRPGMASIRTKLDLC